MYIPLAGVTDVAAERARLEKELGKLAGLLKGLDAKLAQETFVAKAPPAVVERERQRREDYAANLSKLESRLRTLRS